MYASANIAASNDEERMEEVRKIHVDAPVKMNQVLVSHFLGTDVDLIASRSMTKKEA